MNTTGATLFAAYLVYYTGATDIALIDSKSNGGWSAKTPQDSATSGRGVWYIMDTVTTVGSGHTFTLSASANLIGSLFVIALSGSKASAPFDQQNGSAKAFPPATTFQLGSVTPSEGSEIVLSGVILTIDGGTLSIDSGFTLAQQCPGASGTAFGGGLAYKIKTDSDAEDPTWTASSADYLAGTNITLKTVSAPTFFGTVEPIIQNRPRRVVAY